MDHDRALADRIRAALAEQPTLREVKMFGGLSFMVNDGMAVGVRSDGNLLVRADPARNAELLAMPGARPAEMGTGRVMGESWITVGREAVATDADLDFWIGIALDYNRAGPGSGVRNRRRRTR